MARVAVAFTSPGTVDLVEEDDRPLLGHEVRVRTLYSGISTGTEMSFYRNTSPYMHKRWDDNTRLFLDDPDMQSTQYPVVAGYEEVGEIVEVGADVEDCPTGTIIYGTWGHRSEQILDANYVRNRVLAQGADPLYGIFSHIGAITLNGIIDSSIRLGETVVVFGLGVVGQLVAQLARLSGAEVVGVDLIGMRLSMAEDLGAGHVINGRDVSAAEEVKRLTGGRGADVCIEASGSTQALNEAIRACAYSSKVVALGFFQGAAQGLYLGEEFHHNRINIVCSQISGIVPDLQHRWDRPRLAHTFMRLAVEGKVQVRPLVTHVVPPEQAPELFRLLDEKPSEVVQAVIDFGGSS